MSTFADHDAYIAATPEPFRPLLTDLRAELARALPDAEELIMYDMPGFGFGKAVIAGYAAFSRQCGLYVSNGAIAARLSAVRNLPARSGDPTPNSGRGLYSNT